MSGARFYDDPGVFQRYREPQQAFGEHDAPLSPAAMDHKPNFEHRDCTDQYLAGALDDAPEQWPLGFIEHDRNDGRGVDRNHRGKPRSSQSSGSKAFGRSGT